MMHARGITLIGTMETVEDMKQILSTLHREQIMRIRVMCLDDPTPDKIKFCTSMNDEFLQVTGFKSFLDGSLGSRTAKMSEPWKDVEGDGVWAGVAASGVLNDWIATVTKSNFSPVVHAIGDQAVSLALDALADVSEELIPRIEHAQFIADRDIEKIRNKWFGIQPLHQPHDAVTASIAVNEQQASLLHNWRRMVDAGAKLSFGSDWPVAPPDPLSAMRVAIEQGLSRSEALAMSTSIAADSLRTPKAGRFEIGSYGDVVVLDRNPLECDWKKQSPSVIMTILGGKVLYGRDLRNA
jgi:predicted amidohydrolase YtcJ